MAQALVAVSADRNSASAATPARGLRALVDELELPPLQKRLLAARWLDQMEWLSKKAARTQRNYYLLRLTTVVGAVLVPALVSASTLGGDPGRAAKVATWSVSLIVAITAAVEQFFHFGDKWRTHRETLERLKSEGWLYLQLAGQYCTNGGTHSSAFATFADRVENVIGSDVETYLAHVAPVDKR